MKMVPYQTFVTALRLTGRVPDALYWDTADPYHYVRLIEDAASPLLLVGGGDYQSGTRDEGKAVFNELAAWARQRFPVAEAVASWSGQVLEPADAMAFIGRAETEARVWVVTGDSGQGLTHGAIAGLLLGDLVEGRDHPWAELYAPSRLTAGATGSYLKDALKVGKGFAGWLRPGDVGSEADIQPGQGAIVRHGAVPMAVYRDEDGALHRRSAVCTHAGCIVGWNSTATTWDCPCHGSRFAPTGEVIHGPAVKGLADPSSE